MFELQFHGLITLTGHPHWVHVSISRQNNVSCLPQICIHAFDFKTKSCRGSEMYIRQLAVGQNRTGLSPPPIPPMTNDFTSISCMAWSHQQSPSQRQNNASCLLQVNASNLHSCFDSKTKIMQRECDNYIQQPVAGQNRTGLSPPSHPWLMFLLQFHGMITPIVPPPMVGVQGKIMLHFCFK